MLSAPDIRLAQKKKVTIVHNSSQLLNSAYPAKYRGALEKAVRARGIELVLDDEISELPEDGNPVEGKVTTKKSKVLTADYVVRTFSVSSSTLCSLRVQGQNVGRTAQSWIHRLAGL
jgi:NADH dehydrogenase FAD-containing subunit